MILYDLRCAAGHRFEAWFKDSASYTHQAERGAVSCPLCGSHEVRKALMAPALAKGRAPSEGEVAANASTSDRTSGAQPGAAASDATAPAQQDPQLSAEQARFVQAYTVLRRVQSYLETHGEAVGPRFAEEARRIHDGERTPKPIYGDASDEDVAALREEGIEVGRIPWLPKPQG